MVAHDFWSRLRDLTPSKLLEPAPRPFRAVRWLTTAATGLVLAGLFARCADVPRQPTEREREAAYFAQHPNVPSEIAEAIRLGHVLPGMDREQVRVVFGEPFRIKKLRSIANGEQWLYGAEKFHQDHFRSQGAAFYRITFIEGRVTSIDPN